MDQKLNLTENDVTEVISHFFLSVDVQPPTVGQSVFHKQRLKSMETKWPWEYTRKEWLRFLFSLDVVELSLFHPPSQQVQTIDLHALTSILV